MANLHENVQQKIRLYEEQQDEGDSECIRRLGDRERELRDEDKQQLRQMVEENYLRISNMDIVSCLSRCWFMEFPYRYSEY